MEHRENSISKATQAAVHLSGFQHFAHKTEMLKDGYWSDTDTELDQSEDLPDDATMAKCLKDDEDYKRKKEEKRLAKKMLTIKEKEEAVYNIKKEIDSLVCIRKPLDIQPEKELNYGESDLEREKEAKSFTGLKALVGPEKKKQK
jgi:hypothetical protein